MKCKRAAKYKAEKKRLQRMKNNYAKDKGRQGEFIAGAARLFTQSNIDPE